MVFGHLLELVGGPAAAWLYRLIYSFHMPAFVFCSGWFARFDAARFFRRLLYPYLLYQTLYLLFDRLVLHGKAPLQYTTPYWLLWYLFSMMLWTLLLPLIDGAKSPTRRTGRSFGPKAQTSGRALPAPGHSEAPTAGRCARCKLLLCHKSCRPGWP